MKDQHPEAPGVSAQSTPAESGYRIRSRLIHGRGHSRRWEYDHHVVPPMTVSATFRLDSARRGAKGVPGGIRLNIGLEDWHDIIADLTAALEQA